MSDTLTPGRIRADIAEMLHRDPVEGFDRENLFESGLDSIRLLSLVERWRAAGASVTFPELAQRPTLEDWLPLLASRAPAGLDA